jgi:hypothetical protein
MCVDTPTMRSLRRIAVSIAVCAAAAALPACGGDADKSKGDRGAAAAAKPAFDPDALMEAAAGPNRAARSGRIDGQIAFKLRGVPGYEDFAVGIRGPYRYRKDASLPDYDIELGARDYGTELTSVGGRSYISLGTTGYPLPDAVRGRLVRSAAKGRNGLTRTLEQFGVAPWRWETKRVAAGTGRLDGVEVRHVTTGANVGRILRDANTLLGFMRSLGITRAVGLPSEIGPSARRVIVRSVTSFAGESWVGTKDKVLRRSGFRMTFAVPRAKRAAVGGISGGTVEGRLNVTQVGRRQRIAAPAKLGPFADFAVGLEALGEAQDASRGG